MAFAAGYLDEEYDPVLTPGAAIFKPVAFEVRPLVFVHGVMGSDLYDGNDNWQIKNCVMMYAPNAIYTSGMHGGFGPRNLLVQRNTIKNAFASSGSSTPGGNAGRPGMVGPVAGDWADF